MSVSAEADERCGRAGCFSVAVKDNGAKAEFSGTAMKREGKGGALVAVAHRQWLLCPGEVEAEQRMPWSL